MRMGEEMEYFLSLMGAGKDIRKKGAYLKLSEERVLPAIFYTVTSNL